MQGIEADGESVKACPLEGVGVLRQQDAVGGEREIVNPWLFCELSDEVGEIPSQQGLSPGDAVARDPLGKEYIDELRELLKVKNVLAGKPLVMVFGHAVFAA